MEQLVILVLCEDRALSFNPKGEITLFHGVCDNKTTVQVSSILFVPCNTEENGIGIAPNHRLQ